MNLKIQPIGVIKPSNSGITDVLIYSEHEHLLANINEKFEKGTNLLIVHKNSESSERNQVQISTAELLSRKGNLLTVKGIEANNDSLIDIRLKNEI